MFLPHRIRIEQNTPTQDATTGEITNAWSLVAVDWAHFRASSVREFIAGGTEQGKTVGAFRIRSRSGLKRSMRILFDGRTYNVEGVLPDDRYGNDYMMLPVSEITSG